MQRKRNLVSIRIAIVMLLASLAVFATLAKNAQYLPKSNPASYLSIASKMKADSDFTSARIDLQTAQPGPRVLVPDPVFFVAVLNRWEAPFVQRTSLSPCLRHRAPPITLS